MDILQQVKDKLEEMKAKYNQERDEEEYPNHSDGNGMFWSGFFACLKEFSFFVDHLEVKEVDLDKEIDREIETRWRGEYLFTSKFRESAKHFFELGMTVGNNTQKGE